MDSLDLTIVIKSVFSCLPWRGILTFGGILLLLYIAFKLWLFFRDVGR